MILAADARKQGCRAMGRGHWLLMTSLLAASMIAACGGAPSVPTTGPSTVLGSTPPTTNSASQSPSSLAPTSTRPSPARSSAASPSPAPDGLSGRILTRLPTSARVVALTFDAGANADGVPAILAALRSRHVPATFFLTGNFVRQYPDLSRQMAAAGTVGDHTVTHPHLPLLTDRQIKEEVLAARSGIIATTARDPRPFFRFPYGESNVHTLALVNAMGFVAVGWTVDSLGWKGTSGGITVAGVVNRVVAARTPGEIVLMHVGSNPNDGSMLDAAALPTVISRLTALGYDFVALDTLL